MRSRTTTLLLAALLTVLPAGFLMTGCADKVVGPGDSVEVSVPLPAKAGAAVLYRVTVTAADMEPVTALLVPTDFVVAAVLTVPVGADRRFTAEALDDLGTVLYRGVVVTDVAPFGVLAVPIDLAPVVPMVYLSPHFPTVPAGSDFILALRVANLPGLSGIEFDLAWDQAAPVSLDTVFLSPQALLAGAFLSQGSVSTNIAVEVGTIADEAGNGTLAFFQFSSREAFGGDAFPVQFGLVLNFINGVDVPLADIHLDRAQVRLVNPDAPESILGTAESDEGRAVVALPGGDFLVAGSWGSESAGSFLAPLLAQMAHDGTPRWMQTYPSGIDAQGATCLARSGDGSLYLAGNTLAFRKAVGGSFVYRTDGAGTMLFEESLDGRVPLDPDINAVAALPGGGAVVGGSFSFDGRHRFMAVFGVEGYRARGSVINFSGNQAVNDLVALSDTAYIGIGSDDDFGNANLILWRVAEGDSLETSWTRIFDDFGGIERGMGLARAANGDLLLAGSTNGENSDGTDMWVIRTDTDGVERWRHNVSLPGFQEAYDVVSTPDDGCVVVGHADAGDNGTDVFVVRLDANGGEVWQRTYGGSGYDAAFGVDRLAGGGYVVVGSTSSARAFNNDVLVLRLDEAGLKMATE